MSATIIKDIMTPMGKKLFKTLKELEKLEVRVGYQAGKTTYKDSKRGQPMDVAEVAAQNELGTDRIPSRPFLRNSVDSYGDQINKHLDFLARQIVVKQMDPKQVLNSIGVFHKGLVQKSIVEGAYVPNAPLTIALKGSSKPLIDTGLMRQSVNYVIVPRGSMD